MTAGSDETLAEIRRLYFETTAATIQRDFDRAIDLLKSLPGEQERERATVYMQGLAEMRKEWRGSTGSGSPRARSRGERAEGRKRRRGPTSRT